MIDCMSLQQGLHPSDFLFEECIFKYVQVDRHSPTPLPPSLLPPSLPATPQIQGDLVSFCPAFPSGNILHDWRAKSKPRHGSHRLSLFRSLDLHVLICVCLCAQVSAVLSHVQIYLSTSTGSRLLCAAFLLLTPIPHNRVLIVLILWFAFSYMLTMMCKGITLLFKKNEQQWQCLWMLLSLEVISCP